MSAEHKESGVSDVSFGFTWSFGCHNHWNSSPSQVLLPNLVITAHICTGGDWCIRLMATKNPSIKSSDILWQCLGLWKADDFLPVYFSALHYWNDIFCHIIQHFRVMMEYFHGNQLVFVTIKVSLSENTSVDKWRCGHSKTNFLPYSHYNFMILLCYINVS